MTDPVTITSQLRKLAKEDPEKAAFVFLDKDMNRTVLSRQDVWDKSTKYAAVLRRLGVVKGDIVCNTLPNSPERLITTYGTLLAGAVSMHGQILLADGEDIIKNWKDSKCKAVIVDPKQERGAITVLERIKFREGNTGEFCYRGLPHLNLVIPIVLGSDDKKGDTLQTILNNEQENYIDGTVKPDDVSFIFTTSGSTGFSKLVPHTGGNLLRLLDSKGTITNNVYFNSDSLGWMAGAPIKYPVSGSTRVLFDDSYGKPDNPGHLIVKAINQEGCKTATLFPVDIQLILNTLDSGVSISQPLHYILTGGGPVSTKTMQAIGPVTKSIMVVYASSECGVLSKLVVTDPDSYENSCVGHPAKGVELKVLNEKEQECATGEIGVVFARGPKFSNGYLNDPENSKKAFLQDGWYRTSDVGHVNEKGQYFVHCREANAINHKGFLHYPGWMEARINKHPDIQKAVVVGTPNPANHEEICLCLIQESKRNLTVDDIREFCKSLFLTSEKDDITPIPQHYLFFDAFPLNNNGKIDRRVLKDNVAKRLLAKSKAA